MNLSHKHTPEERSQIDTELLALTGFSYKQTEASLLCRGQLPRLS